MRELAPWEVPVHDIDRHGLLVGMGLAAIASGMFGIRRTAPNRVAVRFKPETPGTKQRNKAQRIARKARRKGEAK